jgi:hypothetical protein
MVLIPKNVLELHRLAHDDNDRQALSSIYIDLNRAVVTNGHHLTMLEHGLYGLEEAFGKIPNHDSVLREETSILIPKSIAESILRGSKTTSTFSLEIYPESGQAELSREDVKTKDVLKLRFDIDYTSYPDIDQVIKQQSDYDDFDSTGLCGLSLKYLSDFFKYLKAVKAPWGGMFRQKSDLEPVRIDVDTGFGALTFILMPVRI